MTRSCLPGQKPIGGSRREGDVNPYLPTIKYYSSKVAVWQFLCGVRPTDEEDDDAL